MNEIDKKILKLLPFQNAKTYDTLARLSALVFPPSHVIASAVDYSGKAAAPDTPGVYFLLDGQDIHYIGRSRYLCRRVAQHMKKNRCPFDRVWWIEVDEEEDADFLEFFYIEAFAPPYNDDRGRTAWFQDALMALHPDAAEWHKEAKEMITVITPRRFDLTPKTQNA
jgi:hypothetical protein